MQHAMYFMLGFLLTALQAADVKTSSDDCILDIQGVAQRFTEGLTLAREGAAEEAANRLLSCAHDAHKEFVSDVQRDFLEPLIVNCNAARVVAVLEACSKKDALARAMREALAQDPQQSLLRLVMDNTRSEQRATNFHFGEREGAVIISRLLKAGASTKPRGRKALPALVYAIHTHASLPILHTLVQEGRADVSGRITLAQTDTLEDPTLGDMPLIEFAHKRFGDKDERTEFLSDVDDENTERCICWCCLITGCCCLQTLHWLFFSDTTT
ncbi:hypothetical protein EBZ39_05390 [bacterium]|nr:hypothetical protein [bacterium]